VKLLLLLLFSVLGGSHIGCASTMSEEERYERQDALILAKEEFQQRSIACRKQNGVMMLKDCLAGSSTARCRTLDYKMAQCVSFR